MSFSGIVDTAVPPVTPSAFDYLSGGPGLAELQRVAAETVAAVLGGQQTTVRLIGANQYYTVPPNQVIAAIWGGSQKSANLLGGVVVNTMVAEQRARSDRKWLPVNALATNLPPRLVEKLYNNGDPSSCSMLFESSMGALSRVAPVVPSKDSKTGWCERDLIFYPYEKNCEVGPICRMRTDSSTGATQLVSAPAPSPTEIVVQQADTLEQRPPTHVEIDAAIAEHLKSLPPEARAPTLEELERAQDLSELAAYLSAAAQARVWLTMALHLPTTAADAQIWGALRNLGISSAEALDWFVGCNAGLECFRERMNLTLGEAIRRSGDNRAKLLVCFGTAAVAAFALLAWRGAR